MVQFLEGHLMKTVETLPILKEQRFVFFGIDRNDRVASQLVDLQQSFLLGGTVPHLLLLQGVHRMSGSDGRIWGSDIAFGTDFPQRELRNQLNAHIRTLVEEHKQFVEIFGLRHFARVESEHFVANENEFLVFIWEVLSFGEEFGHQLLHLVEGGVLPFRTTLKQWSHLCEVEAELVVVDREKQTLCSESLNECESAFAHQFAPSDQFPEGDIPEATTVLSELFEWENFLGESHTERRLFISHQNLFMDQRKRIWLLIHQSVPFLYLLYREGLNLRNWVFLYNKSHCSILSDRMVEFAIMTKGTNFCDFSIHKFPLIIDKCLL